MLAAQNVRAFRHEMHAAENDVAAVSFGGLIGKLQRIAAKIGEFHDFVTLVMMSQNHNITPQARFRRADALVQRIVRDQQIGIEIAADSRLDFGRPQCRGLRFANQKRRVRYGNKSAHGLMRWLLSGKVVSEGPWGLDEFSQVWMQFSTIRQ